MAQHFTPELLNQIRTYPHLLGNMLGKTKLTIMHSYWIRYVWESGKFHNSFQAHRGSYKTTAIVVIGSIWWMLFHPNDRIAIIRDKYTDACEVVNTIKLLMKEPFTKALFEYAHGRALKTLEKKENRLLYNFKGTKTPEASINAFGIDTGIVGKHFDVVVCDDIIVLKDRLSQAKRERTRGIVHELRANIIDPGCPVHFIGTPWHKRDAWQACPEPIQFDVTKTGILSEEEIRHKRTVTTGPLWAANYELKHVASDEAEFANPTFTKWHDGDIKNLTGHLDAAFSGDNTTALTFMGEREDRFPTIGWTFTEHINEKLNHIASKWRRYKVGTIYTETNADKGFVAMELRKRGVVVSEYHEDMNKHHKITTHLKAFWDKIDYAEESDETYLEQIVDYTEGQEPDDAPDSHSSLIREHFYNKYYGLWDI
jgi:hypothetical protein